jgi:hypothetical protein
MNLLERMGVTINRQNISFSSIRVFACLTIILATSSVSVGDYLKMNPPPDIDKVEYAFGNGKSCWVATASNQLAGAGYGNGDDVQGRADDIYRELCENLVDCNNSGWTETALSTWLNSQYNTWPNNPYIVVNVYGKQDNRPPYARTDLPEVIGNNLRKCNFISLSIRQPTCDTSIGKGGHAVTCWGDNGTDTNTIDSNPSQVKITDSDYWDATQVLQTYTYDDYNNPNPNDTDDCNEGPGWYFDYWQTCHWYIDHFGTFEPTRNFLGSLARTLVASAQCTYNGADPCAFLLHYKICANSPILSYRTSIDWDTNNPPAFFEDNNRVTVTWNLIDNPVPQGTTITATAEIVVPRYDIGYNSITIGDIGWVLGIVHLPGGGWWNQNLALPGGSTQSPVPNMCGGYVICACTLYAGPSGPEIGEYRGQFMYDYYEDPCRHEVIFEPNGSFSYFMGNFRFGHSYGLLMDDELPNFDNWKTVQSQYPPYQPMGTRTFMLDWTGTLPYPQGQDYIAAQNCGDQGTFYADGDVNKDCKVDWQDFALFADSWLWCTDPNQDNCP